MHIVSVAKDQIIKQPAKENDHSLCSKIFIHNDPNEAISEMNEWLQNSMVDVQHICQSQSEKGGKFIFIMTLFYKEVFTS